MEARSNGKGKNEKGKKKGSYVKDHDGNSWLNDS